MVEYVILRKQKIKVDPKINFQCNTMYLITIYVEQLIELKMFMVPV